MTAPTRIPPKARNPWPIVIIGFFVLFFSGLVSFIVFASSQHDDLVRADYYEEEIHYQLQLDRVNRTQAIGEAIAVAFDPARQCITIQLPKTQALPSSGQIHLYRPSDARLDQELPLAIASDGTQYLDASRLRSGLWKVRVQWVVAGREFFFDQAVVVRAGLHPR